MPDYTNRAARREEQLPDGTMQVFRQSRITGALNSMVLPVTPQQLDRWYARQDLIQNIFPDLDNQQREFLMTGSTQEEWEALFGKTED